MAKREASSSGSDGRRRAIRDLTKGKPLGDLYRLYAACDRVIIAPAGNPGEVGLHHLVGGVLRDFLRTYPLVAAAIDADTMKGDLVAADSQLVIQGILQRNLHPIMAAASEMAGRDGIKGLKKTEQWLANTTDPATNWEDGEALVYFASRGMQGISDKLIAGVRSRWAERAEWFDMTGQFDMKTADPATGKVRPFDEVPPRFWLGTESSTLDSTMTRVAEWLGFSEFDHWWRKLDGYIGLKEASSYHSQSEHPAYHLFHLCRSDKALEAMPNAIKALLDVLLRGKDDSDCPWLVLWELPNQPADWCVSYETVKSTGIAAAIAFARHRISRWAHREALVRNAEGFLIGSQRESGAWVRVNKDLKWVESVCETAMAIHALWAGEPSGWLPAVQRGVAWLLAQQDEFGRWSQPGVDPVYLTVLVLDAIELGKDTSHKHVTFTTSPNRRKGALAAREFQADLGEIVGVVKTKKEITVTDAAKLLAKDFRLTLERARSRVSIAATRGKFDTNGKKGAARRIDMGSFDSWRIALRDNALDAEDPDEDD